MNKEKLIGRAVIALVLVLFAAIAGEVRRVQRQDAELQRAVETQLAELERNWTRGDGNRLECNFYSNKTEPELLVKFKPEASEAEINRVLSSFNDRIEDRIEAVKGLIAIDDLDDADVAGTLKQYEALPFVEYAEANVQIELDPMLNPRFVSDERATVDGAPNDAMFEYQWALDNRGQSEGKAGADLRALDAWKQTQGSRDVVIAVLDSGVNYRHEDLSDNMWMRPSSVPQYVDAELGAIDDLHGFNAADNSGDPMDDNGHGSHCAGIIGAVGNNKLGVAGINWQVSIMPLKFLSRNGYGSTKDAVEAINYVINRKQAGVNVRVISASWGSTRGSRALQDVIKKAHDNDVLFVAAAGNSSVDTNRIPHYPSNYPLVLSVAALNRKSELARFSNFGSKTVHLAAPGQEILSTWLGNDYFEASGTSMATPYVSGVAALVLAENPNMTVEQVKERLMSTVDKQDDLATRVVSGGRLNAARALAGK